MCVCVYVCVYSKPFFNINFSGNIYRIQLSNPRYLF